MSPKIGSLFSREGGEMKNIQNDYRKQRKFSQAIPFNIFLIAPITIPTSIAFIQREVSVQVLTRTLPWHGAQVNGDLTGIIVFLNGPFLETRVGPNKTTPLVSKASAM